MESREIQSMFRAINERVVALAEGDETGLDLVCECADVGCFRLVPMSAAGFARARAAGAAVLADAHGPVDGALLVRTRAADASRAA